MTLRAPLYTRRWEPDPLGISRRSQDGIRSNLLETTLQSQDAFLRRPRIDLGQLPAPPQQPDRFQAQNLVLTTLRSRDAMLAGHQWTDRPLDPPKQPDRFWAQNLVLTTLASQDATLVGDQVTARQDLGPPQFVRGASSNLVLSTLAGQDATLAGEQAFVLPQVAAGPGPSGNLGSFQPLLAVAFPPGEQWFALPQGAVPLVPGGGSNLLQTTLAGQDASLPGEQSFALPPTGPAQFVRSWVSQPQIANPVPFNQYDWPNPKVAGRIDETWVGSLITTTLAGQDAQLVGKQVFDNPPLGPAQFVRSWVSQAIANPVPFSQNDWPNPRVAARIDESWSRSLVTTTLAGKDARLAGAQSYDLPRTSPPPVRSWIWNVPIQPPQPFAQYDWPLPKRAPQPDRFQSGNLVLSTLSGQDVRLVGVQMFGRPELGPSQFVRSVLSRAHLTAPILGQPGPVWAIVGTALIGDAASASIGIGPNTTYQTRLRSLYLVVSGSMAGQATAVVRDGPPGGPIIFEADLYTQANSWDFLDFNDIDLRATAGNVLTVEFVAGTPGDVQQVNAEGDYVAPGTLYGV